MKKLAKRFFESTLFGFIMFVTAILIMSQALNNCP